MRVIGLDPGTATTGYGVIEGDIEALVLVEYGAIVTPAGVPMPDRLGLIYDRLNELLARHVVVALSVTGQTPEMVESCRLAREYGARVIALTAPASPLAQLADWLIPIIAIETDFIYKPSSSRYAMMMALDLLVTELAVKQASHSRELLRRMKHALDAHRGGGERQPLGD